MLLFELIFGLVIRAEYFDINIYVYCFWILAIYMITVIIVLLLLSFFLEDYFY